MSLALVFSIFAVVVMGSKWSSSLESTRPPDGSTRFVLVGARRVFASSTNTCFLSGHRLCSSHRSHPGCPGSRVRSLFGWGLWLSPPVTSGEMALFLLQNVSGRGTGARRGFAMFLIHPYLLTTSLFLPECIWITLFWE